MPRSLPTGPSEAGLGLASEERLGWRRPDSERGLGLAKVAATSLPAKLSSSPWGDAAAVSVTPSADGRESS